MNQRKPDRRVRRTRQQLRDALMSLILEKGYDAVTIEDITERADLGRTTFYLHYKDKEELLVKSLGAVFDDLVQQMPTAPVREWTLTNAGPMPLAFQHAAENAQLYKIILSGQGGTIIAQKLLNYLTGISLRIIEAHAIDTTTIPMDVFASYMASSLMGMITWWLENDQPYTTEEMIHFFRHLNYLGTAHTMGLSPMAYPPDPSADSV